MNHGHLSLHRITKVVATKKAVLRDTHSTHWIAMTFTDTDGETFEVIVNNEDGTLLIEGDAVKMFVPERELAPSGEPTNYTMQAEVGVYGIVGGEQT